jgi:protein SDA1
LTVEYEDSSDEDSSDGEGGDKLQLLTHHKGSKMTKHRQSKMDRVIRQFKRREERKKKVKYSTDFLPIDLIHDPQNFCEKLFNKLRKSNDRYEVKLLMMRLISRMIGRH